MKKAVVIVLLMATSISVAQFKIDSIHRDFGFEKVYNIELEKSEIAKNTGEWFAQKFNDSKSVIRMNTDDTIIGKGNFDITIDNEGYLVDALVSFTIKASFKQSKYKLEVNDYSLLFTGSSAKIDLKDYLTSDNIEDLIKKIQTHWEDQPNNYEKRRALKLIENDKKIKKYYLKRVMLSNSALKGIKSNTSSLANDLFDYIKKSKEGREW